MFITFECSQCHGGIEIDGRDVGARVTCPHCQAAITVPQTGLGAGTTIGGFKITSKLGVGMDEVYLARQLSMDRNVALKILPATLSMRKDLSARFLNEVKLLAKLEHPHIVMAHEAGEDAGILYLAMAYIEGESLEARLEREGPFSERTALAITRKLAGALAYAWNRHKLLHRDIKPLNVLLDMEKEPRLVDFGLAKSLGTDTGLTMANMMMGTPNYISPEQSQDSSQVDTRADMYSLGAVLYNMVTGEVPFAGTSLVEVIKKQIAEPLPDPREYNPDLSEGCVILMEIMLAKNRNERHESWEAVIADIERVAGGKSPTKELPETGASTLMRIRNLKHLAEVKGRVKVKTGGKPWTGPDQKMKNKMRMKVWAWAGAGVAAALVILLGVILFSGQDQTVPGSAQGPATPGTGTVMIGENGTASAPIPGADTQAAKLNQSYLSALEYVSSHPEDINGSIGRLEEVRKDGAGTEYAQKAGEQIQRLETAKRQKVEAAWKGLKQAVEKLSDQKQYAEGILLLEQYAGLYAAEMESDRKMLAEELTAKDQAQKEEKAKQQAAAEEKKQKAEVEAAEKGRQEAAQTRLNAVMGEAARGLLKGDYEATAKLLAGARADVALLPVTNEIAAAAETAAKVAGMNQVILESFNRENGREMAVEFRNGKVEKLRIEGVAGGKVKGKREISGGFIARDFGVSDLSLREKTRRIGSDALPSPATSIMRGLLACEGGDGTGAEACFKEAGFGLGTALAVEAARQRTERQSLQAYRNLVRLMGVVASGKETEQLAGWIRGKTWSPAQAEQLARGAKEFRTQYGESALARSNDVVLVALEGLSGTPQTPLGTTQPVTQPPAAITLQASPVETMKIPDTPAEKASRAALMEILKLAGVGTDLTKARDLMRQIAAKGYPEADAAKIQEAVAAFEKTQGGTETAKGQWRLLDFLTQAGPEPRPPLLQATEENVKRATEDWRVENHGAIGDVKSTIDQYGVKIEVLNCPAQTVRALGDLPLSVFKCGGARGQIRDIAPLADCPLRELDPGGSPVEDFSVLMKIKTLRMLNLRNTQIKDLNVAQGLTNLYNLNINGTPVKDLSPLKGMTKLDRLTVGSTLKAKDLSPVFECPLTSLGIEGCLIKDLSFVTNFPALINLNISSTLVKDLSPLRGLQLQSIEMAGTPVRDLSPLEGMPLSSLNMTDVPATNLNVLAGMPLRSVHLGHPDLVMDISSLAGKDLSYLALVGSVTAFAPLKEIKLSHLALSFDWIKVPDAAKLPEYIPALESISIPSPGKAEAEIVLRFPNLKRVYAGATMTFEEFKKKFGRKGKEDPKSALPKPPN